MDKYLFHYLKVSFELHEISFFRKILSLLINQIHWKFLAAMHDKKCQLLRSVAVIPEESPGIHVAHGHPQNETNRFFDLRTSWQKLPALPMGFLLGVR